MKYFLAIGLTMISFTGMAQKKVTPVSQSALTGIALPANSKKDSRFLNVLGAKILLEMESKKNGFIIGNTEVLSLPAIPAGGFNTDSLNFQLSSLGWSISPVQTDAKYIWLQKDGRSILAYFSIEKKETGLYFGEASAAPAPPANTGNQNTGYNDQQQQGQQGMQNTGADQNNNTQNSGGNNNQQQGMQNTGADQNSNMQNQGVNNSQQNNYTPVQAGTNNNGIIISTINFDDGWTAQPKADWIQVIKNDITVLLHYAIALPDDLKSGDGNAILDYFWNLLIVPRFNITGTATNKIASMGYNTLYFMEADGMDKNSGQTVHIAFRIFINNGIASCVEITAASKNSYDTVFTDIDKIKTMLNYNKFAISASDITGLWKENSGGFAQYYNSYNGSYAGMDMVSVNSQLTLDEQGHFLLEHKSAGGIAGSQQFFDEKYNGTYTLSNWELVTTDQNGKTTQYAAMYQAVKNGRILYLQDKKYSSQEYFMIRSQ